MEPTKSACGISGPSRLSRPTTLASKPSLNVLPDLLSQAIGVGSSQSARPQGPAKERIVKKRQRKISSCTHCRIRKIKCDKGHPSCSRCQVKGLQCVYIADPTQLDKAPTRLVKKRHRKIKACLHCRTRKITCDKATRCQPCQDANLECTYHNYHSSDNHRQFDAEQAPSDNIDDASNLQQNLNEEATPSIRRPSIAVNGDDHVHVAAIGPQRDLPGRVEHTATQNYYYGTPQIQTQHRHQFPHSPQAGMNTQDHGRVGFTNSESNMRLSYGNRQSQHFMDTPGGQRYSNQQYFPSMNAGLLTQQQLPSNYSPLPSYFYLPLLNQPVHNQPRPLYLPRQLPHSPYGPPIRHREPRTFLTSSLGNHAMYKLDIEKLDTAHGNTIDQNDRCLGFDAENVRDEKFMQATNGSPLQPNMVPYHPQAGG